MFYPSSMPPSSHLLASADRPPSPASSSSSTSSLPQQQLCTSWEQGRCLRGTQCKYLHLSAPSSAPSLSAPTASLISSNTFPGFPTSTSSSHLFSLTSSSPSPPTSSHSPTPLHPNFSLSLADLDDYPLDSKALLRRGPMQSLTNRMAGLSFYNNGAVGGGMGGMNGMNGMNGMGGGGGQRKECWDWLAGRCQRGAMCKYMHAGVGGMTGNGAMNGSNGVGGAGNNGMNDNVCHQWARAGQCQYGDVCKFAHISNFPLPPHSQQRPPLTQQQTNDYTDDDGNNYLPPHTHHNPSLIPSTNNPVSQQSNFPYLSTAASAPPILFRDARLGLDTEVCRFYAKHSRCKYSNACKFVHIHHGQGGVQVSGVTVTIAELQRLCALHGPGGIASMGGGGGGGMGGGMGNGHGNGNGHGMAGKMGGMGGMGGMGNGGGVVGGYDKKAVMALEKEVRELRELKELHDREQRSQAAQQHQSAAERYHPLLPSNSFSSTFSSSSSSPIPQSSPAFSFASTLSTSTTPTTHLASSNKSTPPLGGGLGGSFSPSLLHLNGTRQASTDNGSNKAVGSPLAAFPSMSSLSSVGGGFGSFQLSSAEVGNGGAASLFYSHSSGRGSFASTASSAAELAAVDADEDSQLIAGSTYAALSGSGALAKGRNDMGGVSSGVVCDHCGMNGSVWRDSYSSLCDECHTSLLR